MIRRRQTWLSLRKSWLFNSSRALSIQIPSLHSAPILFYKPLASIIGPNAPIFIPKVAQPVEEHLSDYEVELTIVIGKVAKNVSEADALDYVLGYTGANDVSHIS